MPILKKKAEGVVGRVVPKPAAEATRDPKQEDKLLRCMISRYGERKGLERYKERRW